MSGISRSLLTMLLAYVLHWLTSCTPLSYRENTPAAEDAHCLRWFEKLDTTLAAYDLHDPGSVPVNGFPQLRINRFLLSLRDQATSLDAFAYWLEQMRQLDASARQLEFANLPATPAHSIRTSLPLGATFEQAVQQCGKRLNHSILVSPYDQKRVLKGAQVPDAYQTWQRYAGIYPLAQYAASAGIKRLHRELRSSFQQPLAALPIQGRLWRYQPPPSPATRATLDIGAMLRAANDNPLRIPVLAAAQMQPLFEHFAPVWEIDTRNDNDKIGSVVLDPSGHPTVNTENPTLYVSHAFTRWQGQILLQLLYQIWLPAREQTGVFDLYGGELDSVIWRVTLNSTGAPIAYDSIHACGCYYLLFPGQGYRAITPADGAEPVLSPLTIPAAAHGQRLLLRLASRTHYLQQVAITSENAANTVSLHSWQPLEQLRSLPLPDGSRRSLFGADGIVAASARGERFLLWPFGVASPGAMRQWGTHAIAFVGRRHFDDPYLLDKLLAEDSWP